MVFLIDKELFGVLTYILHVCLYVPPEGSPFYTYFDVDNGIGLLKECLTDCILTLNDVYVILLAIWTVEQPATLRLVQCTLMYLNHCRRACQ